MDDVPLRRTVKNALAVFQAHLGAEDDTLIAALEAGGCAAELARRIVEFAPLAFTRVYFERSKVGFADTYIRLQANGKPGPEQKLDDEPVYREALLLARQRVGGAQAMLTIAIRSAAFRALNDALRNGVKLENLAVAPAIMRGAAPPRKGWWPF